MAMIHSLNKDEAIEAKRMIWDGSSNAEIASKFGVSQNTVMRIKNGSSCSDAPWPDGTAGPLSDIRKEGLAHSRRFATVSNRVQTAIQNGESGDEENTDAYYTAFGAFTKEQRDMFDATARNIKNKDTGLFFRNWVEVCDYNMTKTKQREHDRKIAEIIERVKKLPDEPLPEREQIRQDIVNPDTCEKLDWEDILFISGGKVPIIQVAEAENDENLKFAIRIYFKLLAVSQWGDIIHAGKIYEIKKKIDTWFIEQDELRADGGARITMVHTSIQGN